MTSKTAYDTLAVRPNASFEDIQANYNSLISRLKSQKCLFNPAEYALKLGAIHQAYDALVTPDVRAAYDSALAKRAVAFALAPVTGVPALPGDAASIALRAEAISLRAEAISLRADALSIHAQTDSFDRQDSRLSGRDTRTFAAVPLLKKMAMMLGAAVAVWVVIQLAFALLTNRRIEMETGAAASAHDRAAVQDYYQTHGVRPANAAEAELLNAANRKAESDARKLEREKTKTNDDYRRFEDDARRRADQVSTDLRFAETQAREQARRDDEQQTRELERRTQQREDIERRRIESEQARWRNALQR